LDVTQHIFHGEKGNRPEARRAFTTIESEQILNHQIHFGLRNAKVSVQSIGVMDGE